MPAIMFDFDGTLTYKSPNIWKRLWQDLGYNTGTGSYFSCLFIQFMLGKINHKEWCDLSCEEFMKAGLSKKEIRNITKEIKLIDGAEETFKSLKAAGISLHIVSGNFEDVVLEVLGDNAKYFDSINCNKFVYDKDGKVTGIIDTKYDFSGKADFINEYKEKNNISASNICFVGNGDNDEWAYKSGCKTICINPEGTDHTDTTKWNRAIPHCTNLTQILPEVRHLQLKLPNIVYQKPNVAKITATAHNVKDNGKSK